MLKRRLIAVLYLLDGWIVRSENFNIHQVIGNPIPHVERMVQWDVDELVVLDISRGNINYDIQRDDYRHAGSRDFSDFIQKISSECRIPLTFGGKIKSYDTAALHILWGADKVTLNSMLNDEPSLISQIAKTFGSQAVVASIDYRIVDGRTQVYIEGGTKNVESDVIEWARKAEDLGAGEILLNSIDADGSAKGFDIRTIDSVVASVSIPVIACGGAGHVVHFKQCLEQTGASAVAAGNIFHFTENAYPRAKQFLAKQRNDIRWDR